MKRRLQSVLAILLLLASMPPGNSAPPAPAAAARMDEKHRAFFRESCVECHGAEKQKADLRLDTISFALDTVENAERWQKILNQINSGEMPPEDAKKPEAAVKTEFLDELSRTLVTARKVLGDQHGKITMRRLNRREYQNTMRDLLGVAVNTRDLPSDGSAQSFDTVGASLFMSSDQLEQYLSLGRRALDDFFAPYEQALRGGTLGMRRERYEPETARYPVDVQSRYDRELDLHRKFEQWKAAGSGDTKPFGVVDKAAMEFGEYCYQGNHRWFLEYLALPKLKEGAYLWNAIYDVDEIPLKLPKDAEPGEYTLRVRVGKVAGMPAERGFLAVVQGSDLDRDDRSLLTTREVGGSLEAPEILEIPVSVAEGKPRNFYFMERRPLLERRDLLNRRWRDLKDERERNPVLWVDWVEWEGPHRPRGVVQKRVERREVETWANRDVRGLLGGYYLGGFKSAKQWMATDKKGSPKEFGLPDEAEVKFRLQVYDTHGPSFVSYLTNPLTETGALLTIYSVHQREFISLPPDPLTPGDKPREAVPPGDYMLRVRVGQTPKAPRERAFLEMGVHHKESGFSPMRSFQVTGTTSKPQILEIPVKITSEGPRTFSFREKVATGSEFDLYMESQRRTGIGPDPALWIDWVEWEGPLESGPRGTAAALLAQAVELPEGGAAQARELLGKFTRMAFRDQPATEAYLEKLMRLFEQRRAQGGSFVDAMKEPLSVVLASPGFLYLHEPATEAVTRALSPREIAVRLAYFLWSAPPDQQLLELAARGELGKAEVLRSEVERMLLDPRSYEWVTGLTRQWLEMDRLDFFQFNAKKFRTFDESTKAAAKEEVYRTLEFLVRENLGVQSLLKSDFVVVNGLLANFYGLEGVSGDSFRKVPLGAGSPRGGLLGMAAVLAMGSNGDQTSPIERGAWVLRKLLNDPPPPAPKGVPQLTRLEGKLLTTRERLMAHQEQPQCAQCHRKIDPIGFGLENFNTVGLWRDKDSYEKKGVGKKEWDIDPAGTLHNGPAFGNFLELRDRIAEKPDRFARGFAEALIHYGLGRPVGFSDEELVDSVVKTAGQKNFAVREFVAALVQSPAFQKK
jgi:hypothetical protein